GPTGRPTVGTPLRGLFDLAFGRSPHASRIIQRALINLVRYAAVHGCHSRASLHEGVLVATGAARWKCLRMPDAGGKARRESTGAGGFRAPGRVGKSRYDDLPHGSRSAIPGLRRRVHRAEERIPGGTQQAD